MAHHVPSYADLFLAVPVSVQLRPAPGATMVTQAYWHHCFGSWLPDPHVSSAQCVVQPATTQC